MQSIISSIVFESMVMVIVNILILVFLQEQYPKAFGVTAEACFENKTEFLEREGLPVEKKKFSMIVNEVEEKLKGWADVKSIVLFGVEAHICVQQTALDLLERDYGTYL